jgi:hypothetical protein
MSRARARTRGPPPRGPRARHTNHPAYQRRAQANLCKNTSTHMQNARDNRSLSLSSSLPLSHTLLCFCPNALCTSACISAFSANSSCMARRDKRINAQEDALTGSLGEGRPTNPSTKNVPSDSTILRITESLCINLSLSTHTHTHTHTHRASERGTGAISLSPPACTRVRAGKDMYDLWYPLPRVLTSST